MARTIFHDDWSVDLVAPSGGVTSGTPLLIGNIFCIPSITTTVGKPFAGTVRGVHTLSKTSAQAWSQGDAVYWDAANARADNTQGIGPRIGYATAAAANPSSTGVVRLSGVPASGAGFGVQSQRFHVATATVNAGATLLPALPSRQYQMVNCKAIAVGGNAGTVTTVDILGTQSSGVKLVAFAQGSLTRSTVLTAGGSGAAVLTDGASFAPCDANTAITIGHTGSALDTATFIDVILEYVIL